MNVIKAYGGYFATHVVCAENVCVKWHGFDFKPWHVGVFARTRHGLTLVGVVSGVNRNFNRNDYTWWANYHGEFYAENYSIDSYSAPDDYDVLTYPGSYCDFLDCIEAAVAFLAVGGEGEED